MSRRPECNQSLPAANPQPTSDYTSGQAARRQCAGSRASNIRQSRRNVKSGSVVTRSFCSHSIAELTMRRGSSGRHLCEAGGPGSQTPATGIMSRFVEHDFLGQNSISGRSLTRHNSNRQISLCQFERVDRGRIMSSSDALCDRMQDAGCRGQGKRSNRFLIPCSSAQRDHGRRPADQVWLTANR